MNRFDEPRDLAALDPSADEPRWERMVRGINVAAAGELDRRRAPGAQGVLMLLSGWTRPAAAVCTAIAAGAAAILLLAPSDRSSTEGGVATALGYPDPVAEWVETGTELSLEELLFAMEGAE